MAQLSPWCFQYSEGLLAVPSFVKVKLKNTREFVPESLKPITRNCDTYLLTHVEFPCACESLDMTIAKRNGTFSAVWLWDDSNLKITLETTFNGPKCPIQRVHLGRFVGYHPFMQRGIIVKLILYIAIVFVSYIVIPVPTIIVIINFDYFSYTMPYLS